MSKKLEDEFSEYRGVMASLLRKINPSIIQQDIDDILQDTFINTFISAKKQQIKFPKAFMVKTAIRLANRLQKKKSGTVSSESIEDFSTGGLYSHNNQEINNSPECAAIRKEDFGRLCKAINELPQQCRIVFILKKIYGLTQKEIASRLEISPSTVEKHVAKGLLLVSQNYREALKLQTSNNEKFAKSTGKVEIKK